MGLCTGRDPVLRKVAMAVARRIATRYDRLAANYLAFIKLASIRIWLRVYESAP
jgi:transposase